MIALSTLLILKIFCDFGRQRTGLCQKCLSDATKGAAIQVLSGTPKVVPPPPPHHI